MQSRIFSFEAEYTVELFALIELIIILSLIIILPLIYIRIRGDKDEGGALYQKRESEDWRDTVLYREGKEYLKVMRHDKDLEDQE